MHPISFHLSPELTLATNVFKDVPVILQYDDQPLIEVVRDVDASFTTQFTIFDEKGGRLTKVKGTQLYPVKVGLDTGISFEYPQGRTVCKRDGEVLFQVERIQTAALKAWARLYTPDGRFVVAEADDPLVQAFERDRPLQLGGVTFSQNRIEGCRIGIHIQSDGSMSFGVG